MIAAILFTYAAVAAAAPAGQIAFVSGTEQEDRRVEVVDLASGKVAPVGPGNRDGAPRWSPDGQWLAFSTKTEQGMGIRIVRADGSEPRDLPHQHKWNRAPRWSPDGAMLAYEATDGAESDISPEALALGTHAMVYDLEEDREEQWGGETTGLRRPVWMNAGALIAIGFALGEDGLSTDIWIVQSESISPLPPEAMPSEGEYAEWAAEVNLKENLLAYESNDGGDREIFVLSYKRGSTDVSNHRAADWNPVWQPDGEWLAFESFRSGRRGVYRVFPRTVRVFPVAAAEDHDNWAPAWSPDGAYIAHVSNRTGVPQVFVADSRSGESAQITDGDRFALAPAWRPAP